MPAREVVDPSEFVQREMCRKNIAAGKMAPLPDTLSQHLFILHMTDSHHRINAPGAIIA
jgi:hypothetical protein